MPLAQHDQIVALGREPISPDRPVGDPCRYDEDFEQLQAQLDRLGSLTGEEVDWARVVELATGILKNKSKDLLVMTYLALGLFERHGYAGLAVGLESYGELLRSFWDKCFPKVQPPHGRYNAVQYLADRVLPLVELRAGECRKAPAPGEKEAVHQCAEQMEKFVQAVDEAFRGLPESPNLLPLSRALRALKEKVGPLVGPAPEGATTAPQAGAAPAAGPAVAVSAPEAFATPAQAAQLAARVARYLLAQDNKDARAYLLLRAVHFGALASAPKDGLLPPIPPQRRQFFDSLAGAGNWVNLLTEAEGQFAATPLWLDLQRYSATALRGLGSAYEAAHDAVVTQVVALHRRLPELFDRTFKDGTPFADGATKAWLAEVAPGAAAGGGSAAGRVQQDELAEAVGDARKLLAEAKPAEAVARLAAAVETGGDGRRRFRAQLALAGLLIDMNRPAAALALAEELAGQIEQFRLAEWEPRLAGEALLRLYECLRKAKPKPTPEDVQRSGQVFARLCRLDPAAALKLDEGQARK